MSVWKRVRSWLGAGGDEEQRGEAPTEEEAGTGAGTGTGVEGAHGDAAREVLDPLDREAARLIALADRTADAGSDDQAIAIEAFERLCEGSREVLAIELARRVLARAAMPDLRCRVAERLDARGEEAIASQVLEPMLRDPAAPLDGWMLAAEIAERRGARRDALALYERIVARDVDYPRARERVARLRELESAPRRDEGATLMAEGALARGRYRLVRELGRGGAGTIFLADDTELGRRVALKVYHRRGRADRERLLIEARTAASLEHPGVIRVLDVDETLGAIAMEAIEEGSIRARLGRGAIPGELLLPWIESACEALRYVHGRGIVHRDLKPSNMLLRARPAGGPERVVLTDFGISQRVGAIVAVPSGEGTLAYMPPEQRAGAPAHPAMDVHAIGATIREMAESCEGAGPPEELLELASACMRADPAARPRLERVLEVVRSLRGREVAARGAAAPA